MEPTELEALELERTGAVGKYYRRHGKGKPRAELSVDLTQLTLFAFALCDFDSQMLEQSLAALRRAYARGRRGR